MYPDFKELLSVLNEHRVKYLVVGAYAVSIHAQPRATKDLDILVKADANAQPGPFFRMGREPVSVDILTEIPGIAFDPAWTRRVEHTIDSITGLKANFISAGDLITAKLAAGRPQDVADVDAIRNAAAGPASRPCPNKPKSRRS